MLKRLVGNKGVTMIELIVGMTIFFILVLTVNGIFMSMSRMQNRVIELSEMNGLLDNVANPIVSDLLNASGNISTFQENHLIIPQGNITYSVHYCDTCPGCHDCITAGCADPDSCALVCDPSCLPACAVPCDPEVVGVLLRNCNSPACPSPCSGHPVLPAGFYKGKQVRFILEQLLPADVPVGVTAYRLTVRIQKDGVDVAVREYDVRPLRLNQHS
jgi:hypothetical protein